MLPLLILAFAAAPTDLLTNGDFTKGLDGWKPNVPAGVTAGPVTIDGKQAAHVLVPAGTPFGYPSLYQSVNVVPGDLLEGEAEASAVEVRDGYGVYICIEFHDANGKRLSFAQSAPVTGDGGWASLRVRTAAPDGAVTGRLCLLLNGHGEARFRAARLARLESIAVKPLDGPVTLTVTKNVVCKSLVGFGVEDDGWFYNEENASHGVNAEDIALREARIEWLHPATVRMFFWYKDWNPSGDWATFTFDSSNMVSHYRTLDLYQRLGARVNITGVEWGVADPYGGDPAKCAQAIGALFEHLIEDKGYTCIRDWTLTNEPNGYFAQKPYSFETFTKLHLAVAAEFNRRGLKINVIGSDDTDGFPWFQQCVTTPDYFKTAGVFGSHRYFPYGDRELARFFYDDRLSLLAAKRPSKPFVVGEFGFQDARSGALVNPLMETYPYAVWTAAFCVEGLNRGVAGFSIWCLHEMYYPGNGFMNYGLWNYKDRDWQTRPVYHAWANFCRLTKPGDRVRECTSSHPGHVTAALVGKTLFWVNRGNETAEVTIKGFDGAEGTTMTEGTLHGDRDCGKLLKLDHNRFTAPPQSFGYVR
ncbi:MAG: hypothetical protein HZB26_16040 [Candidatus Hydrogenedentes bacterium]|nr:hypothetical protein [Candidatus Hydrogenedentota bacterium]